jgi:hypothetical protein
VLAARAAAQKLAVAIAARSGSADLCSSRVAAAKAAAALWQASRKERCQVTDAAKNSFDCIV